MRENAPFAVVVYARNDILYTRVNKTLHKCGHCDTRIQSDPRANIRYHFLAIDAVHTDTHNKRYFLNCISFARISI